jgi:hypothetical protein
VKARGLSVDLAKRIAIWLAANWERMLFVVVGLLFLGSCFYLLLSEKVAEAAAVFGLAFLSFLYANVSRFKRFKGLGFEAELWEDKQREAAALIDRLRAVVSIYTHEVVLSKVTAGRSVEANNWSARWKLYDELVKEHDALGQKIDFSGLKKTVDDYFLFDMTFPQMEKARLVVWNGRSAALKVIAAEFGSNIKDSEGYGKRLAQYHAVKDGLDNSFQQSTQNDLAALALEWWSDAKERLKKDFGVEVELDPKVIERLQNLSKLYQNRPVQVTDELIGWASIGG